MVNTFLSKKIVISAAIFLGGLLIALGVLFFPNFYSINNNEAAASTQTPQWTQVAGSAISVPACGSSFTSSTCLNSTTAQVVIDWSNSPHLATAAICELFIDQNSVAASDRLCRESYTWTGAPNTTHSYQVNFYDANWVPLGVEPGDLFTPANSGSFTAPDCRTGTIKLRATLNGQPWPVPGSSGAITFGLTVNDFQLSDQTRDFPFDNPAAQVAKYGLSYKSGGPAGATFKDITPSATQTLVDGGTVTFTFNYVGAQPQNPPTADIKANGSDGPITITHGSSATISWTSSNASSCSISPTPPSTGGATSGSGSTSNLTSTQTYSLSCSGPGGSASDSVTVNVGAQPQKPDLTPKDLKINL